MSSSKYSIPIEHVHFSVRAYNAFKRSQIDFLEQILELGIDGLLGVKNIGHTQIDHIVQQIAQYFDVPKDDVFSVPIVEKKCTEDKTTVTESEKKTDELPLIVPTPPTPPTPLSEQEIQNLTDDRPYLIEITSTEQRPNLIKFVVPLAKSLLAISDDARSYVILKRRFGLEGSAEYTLQEIGDFFDLTRERVRQLEERVLSNIQRAIILNNTSKKWRIPNAITQELRLYSALVANLKVPFTNVEIIQVTEQYFDFKMDQEDIASLKLLLVLLNYIPLSKTISGWGRILLLAWVTPNYQTNELYQAIPSIFRIVQTSVLPISLFDLKIQVNRKRKNKISTETIEHAVKILPEVEILSERLYQLKFECLPSLSDQAFRVLTERNNPLSLQEIAREINRRLVMSGGSSIVTRSLHSQLTSDGRFKASGRSSIWSLANWEFVTTDTILSLMQEFFHLNQKKATITEVYEYVKSKRSDISKRSVVAYLNMRKDLFLRTAKNGYELSAWGGEPHQAEGVSRLSAEEVEKRLLPELKAIFQERQTEVLPVSELAHILTAKTKIPEPTIYVRLRKLPFIKIEPSSEHRRRKVARYLAEKNSDTGDLSKQKTLRDIINNEIKSYLIQKTGYQASVEDIAEYSMRVTGCKKTTFYRYLSELEKSDDIVKFKQDKKLYCSLKIEKDDHKSTLFFPKIDEFTDEDLKNLLLRATALLTIEDVDLGLFQLGKIFENELKQFLLEAKRKNVFLVTNKDINRLVDMIDCIERNGVVTKKHHLSLLREHRNQRAHGEIPNLEERKRLLAYAPFLGDLYVEYIIFFYDKRKAL